MWRYIIGIIIFLFLIFFGVKLFQAATKSSAPKTSTTKTTALPDYSSTAAQVRFTQDGPINSNLLHRSIQITVGRDQTTTNVIQGYEGTVLKTQNVANNQTSYNVFLNALNNAGFTKKKKNVKDTDETAQCPLGFRYTYQLMNTSDDGDTTLWSTSCGGLGNFGGNASTVMTLFQRQIPDYQKFTQDVTWTSSL